MSDLSNMEKRKFERLLEMGNGYILNFSNRTFEEFVLDSTSRAIYDSRYDYGSGSKANRLRGFWAAEGNVVVAKLMGDMLSYGVESDLAPNTYAEFLSRSRVTVFHEPPARRRGAGRQVR